MERPGLVNGGWRMGIEPGVTDVGRAAPPERDLQRWIARPWCMCAFRPFFFASAVYAVLLLLCWQLYLHLGAGLPDIPGGPVAWHAHELVFGFSLAAMAGFVLTAVPEFTATVAFSRAVTVQMLVLWLAARVAYWLSGFGAGVGIALAGALNCLFFGALIVQVTPRLWRDPSRRHRSFVWALLALWATLAGYHLAVWRGEYPLPWVKLGVGVTMVLIVLALTRISMRIVNDAIDEHRLQREESTADIETYRARPPRRNLAMFALALYSLAEFFLPYAAITGWLGLAAAAAVFNLLNDWHVGRGLLSRWPLLLYGVYWVIALGYLLNGLHLLGLPLAASAGLHLLTIGGMGGSIFAVLCIAGRRHAGHDLDPRPWVVLAAGLLALAALLRAASGWPSLPVVVLQAISALAWVAAFVLALLYLARIWLGPRPDGGQDCEEMGEVAALPRTAPADAQLSRVAATDAGRSLPA